MDGVERVDEEHSDGDDGPEVVLGREGIGCG